MARNHLVERDLIRGPCHRPTIVRYKSRHVNVPLTQPQCGDGIVDNYTLAPNDSRAVRNCARAPPVESTAERQRSRRVGSVRAISREIYRLVARRRPLPAGRFPTGHRYTRAREIVRGGRGRTYARARASSRCISARPDDAVRSRRGGVASSPCTRRHRPRRTRGDGRPSSRLPVTRTENKVVYNDAI